MRRGARVAYHDVDKSYASQSTTLTWLVARRLQDSAAAIVAISFDRAEKTATAETGCYKTRNGRFRRWRLRRFRMVPL